MHLFVLLRNSVSNQAVEGDCDVVLDKVAGVLTVTAFKCNTEGNLFFFLLCSVWAETLLCYLCLNLPTSLSLWQYVESTEDMCVGCPTLLPLNHTLALDFVHASLATFNNNTKNLTFTVLEVGRMTSQVKWKVQALVRLWPYSFLFVPMLTYVLFSDCVWRANVLCRICCGGSQLHRGLLHTPEWHNGCKCKKAQFHFAHEKCVSYVPLN